ncbi:MAG: TIGR04279 domain-containing protein, partial [Candidatus Scalindua sp.]|nr:TIGR04279 domain-containing protein [Candidatus Scalindua sp.]
MVRTNSTRKIAVAFLVALIIVTFVPVATNYVLGTSTTKFPVEVVIDNGGGVTDTLRLADHDSTLAGNWITTTGDEGTVIQLPDPIVVEIDSTVKSESFTFDGKDVSVDANALSLPKTVTYPITTQKIYHYPDNVDITFTSSIAYSGDTVELRLIYGSANALQHLISGAIEGDIDPLKEYLHDNEANIGGPITHLLTGANSYSFPHDFGSLPEGLSVAVVLAEDGYGTDAYSLNIYSITPIVVLDYELDVTPVYNDIQGNLETEILVEEASGSSYSYGVVLINQDVYSLYAEVNSDGTVSGTTVDIGVDASPLFRVEQDEFFLGLSPNDYSSMLTQSYWQDLILDLEEAEVISPGDMAVTVEIEISDDNPTLLLNVDEFEGIYWLMTVVYEHDGGKLVGFDQQQVSLGAATITIDQTNLPQPYSRKIVIDYSIDSSVSITDAEIKVHVDVDGNLDVHTETVIIDVPSTPTQFEYTLDTLAYIDGAIARSGASITIFLELWHPIDGYITEVEVSDQITQTSKVIMWERVTEVGGLWPFSDLETKNWLWANLVTNVGNNWP